MRMPRLAFATTTFEEKPACSYKEDLLTARPPFSLMYTKG
jgi:hypothetical protein